VSTSVAAWYDEHDAVGLAELIACGDVSLREVLEESIARIETRNETLNAVVATCYDDARARVANGTVTGPLAGVPILIKDLNTHVAGLPTTQGSRLFVDAVAEYDSEHVARLRRAGCVVLGKTNTPEFGLAPTTEPVLFGPTRNPWLLDHSPGASSGGAAAAVAGGMVPVAHGTDSGGSIRCPASCCGLFGLKPTRARNTVAPHAGEVSGGMAAQHALTRTVRDSAALLDATLGPGLGDPYGAPTPQRRFSDELGRDPGRLRIALITTAPAGANLDPECVVAAELAGRLVEALGHHVEPCQWPITTDGVEYQSPIMAPNLAVTIQDRLTMLGRDLQDDDLEPYARGALERGRRTTGEEYARALRHCHALGRTMAEFQQTYDLILTPTLGMLPLPIGAITADRDRGEYLEFLSCYFGMLPIFNVTGQPAMSVPLHWTDNDVPVGVQFAARFGDEATLFRVAAQLEQAAPWTHRKPPPR
jgi:Asp-tRNA(Asn)/Glu-tRNA(Gln) amidotransferase A subunit family amidase